MNWIAIRRLSLPLVAFGFLACVSISVSGENQISTIKDDEEVILFPTVARWDDSRQHWVVPLHGWIFEPEENDLRRSLLLTSLGLRLDTQGDAQKNKILQSRLRWFLVDNERGKQITIRISGQSHTLPSSAEDGHFYGTVDVAGPVGSGQRRASRLPYEVLVSPQDSRTFSGTVICLPPTGISVISDIDDTIKVSEVLDKQALLRNTFLAEFRAVAGMAELYGTWSDSQIEFHYISASPWQLYAPLSQFLSDARFPDGSVHLRPVRLKDTSVLGLFGDPVTYKCSVIEPLVRDFPNRKFILVGDSGERDPEVYGIIARQFPAQIVKILIRNVSDESVSEERLRNAFRDVAPDKWQVFREPGEIAKLP